MFASETPFMHSPIGYVIGLTNQQYTRRERLVGEKDSSLFSHLIKFVCKGFYNIDPRGQCFKTFYCRVLRIFIISYSFFSLTTISSLMSASKTGAYPSEAPFRCPHLGLDPGLTCQQSTSPERFAGDKHYSLFNTIIKYVCKGFYNISPWW